MRSSSVAAAGCASRTCGRFYKDRAVELLTRNIQSSCWQATSTRPDGKQRPDMRNSWVGARGAPFQRSSAASRPHRSSHLQAEGRVGPFVKADVRELGAAFGGARTGAELSFNTIMAAANQAHKHLSPNWKRMLGNPSSCTGTQTCTAIPQLRTLTQLEEFVGQRRQRLAQLRWVDRHWRARCARCAALLCGGGCQGEEQVVQGTGHWVVSRHGRAPRQDLQRVGGKEGGV